jgi:hypothetical protein
MKGRGRPRKGWRKKVARWRELVIDRDKMEGHCSTGQSPQRAVAPMEEDKEFNTNDTRNTSKVN